MRYFWSAVLAISVLLVLAVSCEETTPDGEGRKGWPSFIASFRETNGDFVQERRLIYSNPNEWEFLVTLDAQDPANVGSRVVFDGIRARQFDSKGNVQLEEPEGFYVPAMYPWGSPVASVSELLKTDDSWTLQQDGSIVRTRSSSPDCNAATEYECERIDVVETSQRDVYGVPVSYERRVNGQLVKSVQRLDFKLMMPD
jgi:hypothetical protein